MEVKGRSDGRIVVLDQPVPVDHEVDVIVRFPDLPDAPTAQDPRQLHWELSQNQLKHVKSDLSEEVIRQRRLE